MVERILLKKLYHINPATVGIFEVENKMQHNYFAALVNENNLEIWGEGKTEYEALLSASEKWGDNMGGFNPFAEALRSFPHP